MIRDEGSREYFTRQFGLLKNMCTHEKNNFDKIKFFLYSNHINSQNVSLYCLDPQIAT